MYTVYILYSRKDKGLYVGCTNGFQERRKKHDAGYVKSTKHRRPLVVIYTEKFKDAATAFKRERFLKSLWGAREKKKIVKNFLAQSEQAKY
ncbi:MAG: excinuclease ABC subunit C [Candidatus Harrisonbacteria bacterium CG10_big_fil_rev_8_21_14_0_10_45_28]|uniref:Excinuclease ABC subunit C n=1 Tax=Candidatus Harrisonbacteria bacterium CG10_big_fil_rev_8_21_14_0_10_45_28 TaxID=1974586 RepID=A0A2H0UN02_9BACT|nr:MAG: excinuclease ABC subunit C [Candidatus Harrisonbacteria bacterium CG10_big_fil_rev_8_21_14_0_10_45_28]